VVKAKPLKAAGDTKALAAIMLFSGAVFLFLLWLVYFKPRVNYTPDLVSNLPALNAFFNGLSTLLLLMGLRAIRRGRVRVHRAFMISAFASSSLFLIGYVTYHNFHGDTRFNGTGFIRPVYFTILISHIALSAVVVPMILSSLYFALSGKFGVHRRISRITFPIWLYVSVTGVLIFLFLKLLS
jgi:putative membrane protein